MSIKIAFKTDGGMGSVLLKTNFIKKFVSVLPRSNVHVTVFGHPNTDITHAIFDELDFVDCIKTYRELKENEYEKYDLVMRLETVPIILHKSKQLWIKSPKYYKIVKKIEQFNNANPGYIYKTAVFRPNIYQIAKMRKKNCVNCIDFDDFIGLGQDFIYTIRPPKNFKEILSKFGLESNKYITLNRGSYTVAGKAEGTRVWPLGYYKRLVRFLQQLSPEIKIVQLGQAIDCPKIDGCDLYLCGKTNLEELKSLLYGAVLHIDGEGGMVHLRKAMNAGPSAVLFGSTDPEYFGHKTNINININACPYKCCELHDLWHTKCLVSNNGMPLCLLSCGPEYVFSQLEPYLQQCGLKFQMWPQTQDLLNDKRFALDTNWSIEWVRFQKIHDWSIKTVKLSDLLYCKHTDGCRGHKDVLLTEEQNPATAFLRGEPSAYNAYNAMKQISYQDSFHNSAQYNKLIKQLSTTDGYDIKHGAIVIKPNNVILDGWHRASWLLNKYGKDHKIQVVQITI